MSGMLRRLGCLILMVWALVLAQSAIVRAENSVEVASLMRALQIDQVMAVLRDEGLASGADLQTDGAGSGLWPDTLRRIYDTDMMQNRFQAEMQRGFQDMPSILPIATGFFASDLGQRVVQMELKARRALLDEDAETAAQRAYDRLAQDNPARQELIDRFVAVNDLIESNVIGGMNANLSFLRGLMDTAGAGASMTEADMLQQVQSAEAALRKDTMEWLFAFLTLAYQPLSDAEVQTYIEFSQSREGKVLNAIMFQAFDKVFVGLSYDLGRAYGMQMQGDDI